MYFFVLMSETEMNSKCISTLRLVRYSEIVVSLFLVTMELILRNEQTIYIKELPCGAGCFLGTQTRD